MKKLKIQDVLSALENQNISVSEYEENGKLCGYELNTYTNASVNQIIFIDFRNTDKNPKDANDFLSLYNERVNNIDIEEEFGYLRQDPYYMQIIGPERGFQDLKDWKEYLQNIFTKQDKKTPQQKQFEQVVNKFRSQVKSMKETLEMMPTKGYTAAECQKHNILCTLLELDHEINGIELEDFTPNECSGNFKLSYS